MNHTVCAVKLGCGTFVLEDDEVWLDNNGWVQFNNWGWICRRHGDLQRKASLSPRAALRQHPFGPVPEAPHEGWCVSILFPGVHSGCDCKRPYPVSRGLLERYYADEEAIIKGALGGG